MRQTFVLKNESTAEKRREKEAFAILVSIAHCCFMETKHNCVENQAIPGHLEHWLENRVVGEQSGWKTMLEQLVN